MFCYNEKKSTEFSSNERIQFAENGEKSTIHLLLPKVPFTLIENCENVVLPVKSEKILNQCEPSFFDSTRVQFENVKKLVNFS